MGKDPRRARGELILAVLLFGTIGLFRRGMDLPSSVIALGRGSIGTLFLLFSALLRGKALDTAAIRRKLPWLILSGGLIGFNWILLFESYRYTTVATATLCYYMAPVIVILASPWLLKERLTLRRGLCAAAAVLGMVLVSGVLTESRGGDLRGVLFGLGAAALYASVVLVNQRLRDMDALEKTVVQLGAAALILLPYVLATEDLSALTWNAPSLLLLLILGVVHTGWAYSLYFGSMGALPAQTVALCSYLDPVTAVLLSALVLREPLGLTGPSARPWCWGRLWSASCRSEKTNDPQRLAVRPNPLDGRRVFRYTEYIREMVSSVKGGPPWNSISRRPPPSCCPCSCSAGSCPWDGDVPGSASPAGCRFWGAPSSPPWP